MSWGRNEEDAASLVMAAAPPESRATTSKTDRYGVCSRRNIIILPHPTTYNYTSSLLPWFQVSVNIMFCSDRRYRLFFLPLKGLFPAFPKVPQIFIGKF